MSGLSVIFSENTTIAVADLISQILVGDDASSFILERYAPTLRKALEDNNVQVGFFAKIRLLFGIVGTLIRFVSWSRLPLVRLFSQEIFNL